MTDQDRGAIVFSSLLDFMSRVEMYSDESIERLKELINGELSRSSVVGSERWFYCVCLTYINNARKENFQQ